MKKLLALSAVLPIVGLGAIVPESANAAIFGNFEFGVAVQVNGHRQGNGTTFFPTFPSPQPFGSADVLPGANDGSSDVLFSPTLPTGQSGGNLVAGTNHVLNNTGAGAFPPQQLINNPQGGIGLNGLPISGIIDAEPGELGRAQASDGSGTWAGLALAVPFADIRNFELNLNIPGNPDTSLYLPNALTKQNAFLYFSWNDGVHTGTDWLVALDAVQFSVLDDANGVFEFLAQGTVAVGSFDANGNFIVEESTCVNASATTQSQTDNATPPDVRAGDQITGPRSQSLSFNVCPVPEASSPMGIVLASGLGLMFLGYGKKLTNTVQS